MSAPAPSPTPAALQNIEDIYPLTPVQQGMLFEAVHRPASPAHHEQFTFLLRGRLDTDAMGRTWQALVDRHAALRAQFAWQGVEQPLQAIRKRVTVPFSLLDWSGDAPEQQDARLADYLTADRARPFDPTRPPLMRVVLVRLSDDLHRIIWSFQHLILDAWSVSVLLSDLPIIYQSLCSGSSAVLPPAPRFRDYMALMAKRPAGPTEAHWRALLDGFEAATEVPGCRDASSLAGRPSALKSCGLSIGPQEYERLKAFARAGRTTLSTVVQAAWALLLSQYSGDDDVVFGATVSARPADLPGVENTVGMFMNVVPVRAKVPSGGSVAEFLGEMHAQGRSSSRFHEAPAADLQRWRSIRGRSPLHGSILAFANYPLDEGRRSGTGEITLESPRSYGWTTVPLLLMVTPGRSSLDIEARFDEAVMDPARTARAMEHFRNLLVNMATDASAPLDGVNMLSVEDWRAVTEAGRRGTVRDRGAAADGPKAGDFAVILDARLRPVPRGLAGDLYVGGEAASAEGAWAPMGERRFVEFALSNGLRVRVVKTGDRARLREDGVFERNGRCDEVVRVRGGRVELAVVERAVLAHPGVAEAAVVAMDDADARRLVVYIVRRNGALRPAELDRFLRTRLPGFMVPASIVPVPALPRLEDGRTDRSALPRPGSTTDEPALESPREMSEVEATLSGIFREVLSVENVGLRESFFDLGGHSILAVRLASRVEAAFKVRLPLAALLAAPTVEALAETISGGGQDAHRAPIVKVRTSGSRTPLFCIHGMDGNVLFLEALARGLSADQPVYGVQARGMDGAEPPETSAEAMAALYVRSIQEVQPKGPYILSGYSLGGMVALEVAHLLVERGETVSRIVLFDTRIPRAASGRSLNKALSQRIGHHIRRGPRAFLRSLYIGPVERGAWRLLSALGLPVPLRLRVWPVRLANLRAFLTHQPRPWAGPISLIRADTQEGEFIHMPALGWEDFAKGELEIRPVPAEHLSLFSAASIAAVARETESILRSCAAPVAPAAD